MVRPGQTYEWLGTTLLVLTVAKNGKWAEVFVTQPQGASWIKKQPLPLPDVAVLVGT
jgi:hypothetical protein